MLFDRDEDGVLSFQELQVVMKSMGQRPSGGAGTSIVLTRVCTYDKSFCRRRPAG